MKTEHSLRKLPIESRAAFPVAQRAGVRSRSTGSTGAGVMRRSPAMTEAGVFADLTPSVYATLILSWIAFMSISIVTFAGSPSTLFLLALCGFYAMMFFGVPIALNRLGARQRWTDPGLLVFLRGKVDTIYGPVNGLEALVQVIVVPACLTLGGIAIGFAIASARAMH